MYELRAFFSKTDLARYVSHLDLNRAFMRAMMAAEVDVWFSEGFNQHPHIVFSQPLPLGFEGLREVLDFRLNSEYEPDCVVDALNGALQCGLRVISAAPPVGKLRDIAWAGYETRLDISYRESFERMWAAESVVVEKRSKSGPVSVDLKQSVKSIELSEENGKLIISSIMPCSGSGSLPSSLFIDALTAGAEEQVYARHVRTGFFTENMTDFK